MTLLLSLKKTSAYLFLEMRSIALALSFLTRISFFTSVKSTEISNAFCWLPLIGLFIGVVSTIPVTIFSLFSSHYLVQGWIYTLISLWLTRALHIDGFADVLDALGSGKSNEEFYRIMKDSRIGAFGAAGIALVFLGYSFLATAFFEAQVLAPLIWAPIIARCLPIYFALVTSPYPLASLGTTFSSIPKRKSLIIVLFFTSTSFIFLGGTSFFILCFCALWLGYTRKIAQKHGGYNGDLLGFLIIGGELITLLSCLAFT